MKRQFFQDIMDQVVPFPGFFGVNVTRGWLYQFLKSRGWDESERGFGSMDYLVFAARALKEEATEAGVRDHCIAQIEMTEPEVWQRVAA